MERVGGEGKSRKRNVIGVILGFCVGVDGNCGVVGYCVGSGGDLLWVVVWGVVVICYGL